jgi:hypothetical protein
MPVSGSVIYYMLVPTKYPYDIQIQGAQLWKGKRKRSHFVLTGHIQCKQSLSPRSLELRGNFQTYRWSYILRSLIIFMILHLHSKNIIWCECCNLIGWSVWRNIGYGCYFDVANVLLLTLDNLNYFIYFPMVIKGQWLLGCSIW